jgi:hypothetical protein
VLETTFSSPALLLDHVTHNWLVNTVTTDLRTYEEVEPFLKRPFFLLVAVDGPLRTRFERERRRYVYPNLSVDRNADEIEARNPVRP